MEERETMRVLAVCKGTIDNRVNFLKRGHPFYQFWEEAQQCVKVKDMF